MDRHPEKPILIVDDEESWLVSLEVLLARQGIINNVVSCSDSWRVMGLLKEQEFSLILLDYAMPGCSGEEILTYITESYPQLPVVMLTGVDQAETAARCLAIGAKNFLVKTLDEKQMIAVIEESLGALS